jgi:N-acetyl-gamma-glutamyl-phosphate reductase
MSEKNVGVGILGGTGYGAGELLRLLAQHPAAQAVSVVSSSTAGGSITDAHPHLSGVYEGKFDAELNIEALRRFPYRVLFSALPHGTTAETVQRLLPVIEKEKIRLIDLSADYRLEDPEQHKRFYPESESPAALRKRFVYGLPELNRDRIATSTFIANPGCLATAGILSMLPLVRKFPHFAGTVVIDAKTGTSGAGRGLQQNLHHPMRHSSIAAYKILEHRHEPEIRQGLGDAGGEKIVTQFVPHLLPVSRGIFVSSYLTLESEVSTADMSAIYRDFYNGHPFVRVRNSSPELHSVVGSNFCDISVICRGRQVMAMAVLDNLVKGMAGQAIQNMNLQLGFLETAGLQSPALGPV